MYTRVGTMSEYDHLNILNFELGILSLNYKLALEQKLWLVLITKILIIEKRGWMTNK